MWGMWGVDARRQGGYNIGTLVQALDNPELADEAAKQLSHTLLMFDAFYDVEAKAKAGNAAAKRVMESWYVFSAGGFGLTLLAPPSFAGMTCRASKRPRNTGNADIRVSPCSPRLGTMYSPIHCGVELPCESHLLSTSQHFRIGLYSVPCLARTVIRTEVRRLGERPPESDVCADFRCRAAAEWFTAKPPVPEKMSVTVFKVRMPIDSSGSSAATCLLNSSQLAFACSRGCGYCTNNEQLGTGERTMYYATLLSAGSPPRRPNEHAAALMQRGAHGVPRDATPNGLCGGAVVSGR